MVVLSPDGVLGLFPWAALPGREPGRYLIEEKGLAVVAVPQLLPELLAPRESAPPSLLLVGDVNYGDSREWSPLPSTGVQIRSIAGSFEEVFPGQGVKELVKTQATRSEVRQYASQYRYLHFATHGFFEPEQRSARAANSQDDHSWAHKLWSRSDIAGLHPGILSGLVLAGAKKLTALEVAELDLSKVELATLSACDTGEGKSAGGEGLLGLQRAFQIAGARSVVASLWDVPADETRALMLDFYDNLWRTKGRKLSKAEALQAAQLAMLRQGVKRGLGSADKDQRLPPFYWAAFVLSGDWR